MIILYNIFLVLLLALILLSNITLVILMDWSSTVFNILTLITCLLWIASWKQKYFACVLSVFCLSIAAFFNFISPKEQFKGREWEISCSRMPKIDIDGNKVVIHDMRDFKYRAENDFDVNYINAEYDLSKLESMDLLLSHWDGMDNIAHMLLCFNFSDNKKAVLSVEMRCPQGTSRAYHTTFFKQHALIYIWATPEDIIDLRTKYRTVESVYRYRTTATPEELRFLFTELANRTNYLRDNWEFYMTITGNCTTELLPYLKKMRSNLKWDYRALFNGSFDRLLFEQGLLKHRNGEEFESLRARSFVHGKASGKAE